MSRQTQPFHNGQPVFSRAQNTGDMYKSALTEQGYYLHFLRKLKFQSENLHHEDLSRCLNTWKDLQFPLPGPHLRKFNCKRPAESWHHQDIIPEEDARSPPVSILDSGARNSWLQNAGGRPERQGVSFQERSLERVQRQKRRETTRGSIEVQGQRHRLHRHILENEE